MNEWESVFPKTFSSCFAKKVLDLKESVYLLNSFNQSNSFESKKKASQETFNWAS